MLCGGKSPLYRRDSSSEFYGVYNVVLKQSFMCFRVKEYPGTITNALFSVEKSPLAYCLDALREATFRKKKTLSNINGN